MSELFNPLSRFIKAAREEYRYFKRKRKKTTQSVKREGIPKSEQPNFSRLKLGLMGIALTCGLSSLAGIYLSKTGPETYSTSSSPAPIISTPNIPSRDVNQQTPTAPIMITVIPTQTPTSTPLAPPLDLESPTEKNSIIIEQAKQEKLENLLDREKLYYIDPRFVYDNNGQRHDPFYPLFDIITIDPDGSSRAELNKNHDPFKILRFIGAIVSSLTNTIDPKNLNQEIEEIISQGDEEKAKELTTILLTKFWDSFGVMDTSDIFAITPSTLGSMNAYVIIPPSKQEEPLGGKISVKNDNILSGNYHIRGNCTVIRFEMYLGMHGKDKGNRIFVNYFFPNRGDVLTTNDPSMYVPGQLKDQVVSVEVNQPIIFLERIAVAKD